MLECLNAERTPLLERQVQRNRFEQQMQVHRARIPQDELLRNQIFLELQALLHRALHLTGESEGGVEALQRFNAVADPMAHYEKTYG
ncbi:hypothetical protein D3C76_1494160 [compost metagenome]